MDSIIKELKLKAKKPVVKKVAQGSNGKIVITKEMIAKKAYELYEKHGRKQGCELQDWNEAKRILEAGA